MIVPKFFLSFCLLAVWLVLELAKRQKAGLKPASFKEFWSAIAKNAKNCPDWWKPLRPLFFTLSNIFVLSFWEGCIRFLFVRKEHPIFFGLFLLTMVLGITGAYVFPFHSKQRRLSHLAIWLSWALSWQAYFSMVLLTPWLVWRLRFISARQPAKN